MAIRIWRGDAQATAQVTKITPSSIESGDVFTITINRKTISVTADPTGSYEAAGTDTEVNLVHNVVSQLAAIIGTYGSGTTAIPEFVELAAAGYDADSDGLYDYLLITGPTDGRPFTVTGGSSDAGNQTVTVTVTQAGSAGTNEIQTVTFRGTPTGGTFTLTFQGETTSALAYNASAATVETALEALTSVTSGDVSVSGDAGGPYTIEFTGNYAATNVPIMSSDGSSLTGGNTVSVEVVTEGGSGANEIWSIDWDNTGKVAGDSDWVDHFDFKVKTASGVSSATITGYEFDTASSLESHIGNVVGVGVISVTKTYTFGGVGQFQLEWIGGALAGTNIGDTSPVPITIQAVYDVASTAHATTAEVTTAKVQDGGSPDDEVQLVSLPTGPTGGTFTLTFQGQTTGAIAYNASAATVKAALDALSNITAVSVTGTGPWEVTFDGATWGGTDVALMTGSGSSLTGMTATHATTQNAVASTNEKQRIELSGNVTSGTFTLTWDPGGGDETTGNIAYNASASTVQTALEGLATPTAGDFSVTGVAGGPWVVEFTGSYAAADVNAITGDGSSLSGAGSQAIAVASVTTPTGPNWFSDANNWQTPGSGTATAPTTGDTVVFQDSEVDCLYGLDDLSAETFAEVHIRADYVGSIGLPSYEGDYFEYRATALKAGMTKIIVGEGEGAGSPRVRLDASSIQCDLTVHRTGTSADSEPALIWKGTHASNTVAVLRGDVGIGTEFYGDACAVSALKVGFKDDQDGDVSLSIGVGITALGTVVQLGGVVTVDSGSGLTVTSWAKYGGSLYFQGEGAMTTLLELEGSTYYESSGTLTTCEIGNGGEVAATRDLRSRTITTLIMEAGSTFRDPSRVVTLTNGIVLRNCGVDEVTIDVGYDVKLTVAAAP